MRDIYVDWALDVACLHLQMEDLPTLPPCSFPQFYADSDFVFAFQVETQQIQNLSTRFRFKSHQFFQLELDTNHWKWILFLRMWGDLGPRDGELTMEEYQAHLHVMSSGLMIDPIKMCPLSTCGFCHFKCKCYMMFNVQSLHVYFGEAYLVLIWVCFHLRQFNCLNRFWTCLPLPTVVSPACISRTTLRSNTRKR